MKDRIKKIARSTKDTIVEHRGTVVFIACASAHVLITTRIAKTTNAFLEEKGLDSMELWNPEYYEELNP